MKELVLVDENGVYYGTVIAYVTHKVAVYNEKNGKKETLELQTIQKKKLKFKVF